MFREHVGLFTIGSLHSMSGPISGTAPLKEASFPQRDGTCRTLDAGYNIYAPTYTTYTHPICVYVVSHLRAIVRPRIGRGSSAPPPSPSPAPVSFFGRVRQRHDDYGVSMIRSLRQKSRSPETWHLMEPMNHRHRTPHA